MSPIKTKQNQLCGVLLWMRTIFLCSIQSSLFVEQQNVVSFLSRIFLSFTSLGCHITAIFILAHSLFILPKSYHYQFEYLKPQNANMTQNILTHVVALTLAYISIMQPINLISNFQVVFKLLEFYICMSIILPSFYMVLWLFEKTTAHTSEHTTESINISCELI